MNLCIMTVCDYNYRDFIPVFLMSAHKAFPDYAIKVYYRGMVDDELLSYCHGNEISDNFCPDFPFNKATTSTMRFCLPDECRPQGCDYFYITDIDMLFVDESVSLHEQHLKIMERTGLCYENFAVPSNKYTFRMPGVHFAGLEWWGRTKEARDRFWSYLRLPDSARSYDFDESVLFKIHQESGLGYTTKGFEDWRWHALHLGRYLPRKGIRQKARNINNANEIVKIRQAIENKEIIEYMQKKPVFSEILETWNRTVNRR